MSCPQCGCAIPEVVNIPGTTGPAGANGSNGQSAFTVLTASATFPNTATPVVCSVLNSTWMAVGQVVFLSDGTNFATCKVTAVSAGSPTAVTLQWLNYNGDGSAPVTVNNSGSVVSAGRTITTPVTVANGGTGAATLAGILYGNGTSAITAQQLTGLLLGNGVSTTTAIPLSKGTFIANGATPVNVSATAVTANSMIIITLNTVGGTVGAIPAVQTITPGTGFSVKGTASDTSTYNFLVLY